MKRFLLILLMLLLLVSCSSLKTRLSGGFSLLPPSVFTEPMENSHLVYGTFPGMGDMVAEGYLEVTPEEVYYLVSTTTGQTILEVTWNGKDIDFSSSFISGGDIAGAYILRDLEFIFLPVSALSSSVDVEESTVDGVTTRTISSKGVKELAVTYKDGIITDINFQRGYDITLETF